MPFPRLLGVPKDLNPALTERVKARRDACKKAMASLADALDTDSETLLGELRQTAPAMEALLALTLRFDARYAADKRRAGLVDYADLEHLAAELLTDRDGRPTPLAAEIASRYDEIMVDEYQDVSPVQEEIFRAISREDRNRFLVGDVKQSIYRFRLADPGIFTGKYDRWPLPGEADVRERIAQILSEGGEPVDVAIRLCLYCMKTQIFNDGNKRAAVIFANHYLIGRAGGLLVIPERNVSEFKRLLVRYYEGRDEGKIAAFLKKKCWRRLG